jgi:hypothetical protein
MKGIPILLKGEMSWAQTQRWLVGIIPNRFQRANAKEPLHDTVLVL